ncbi:MAG: Fe-S cluster assembly scaffold protein NifU [Bacillota bacterium]
MYSEKVMDHFTNPRNVGKMEDADVVGEVGNPTCGDIIRLYLKVNGQEEIEDIKFSTFGCGAAVATSSMVTELVKGKKVDEALKVGKDTVAEALDGLPANKMHCSNLATEALGRAIEKLRGKNVEGKQAEKEASD